MDHNNNSGIEGLFIPIDSITTIFHDVEPISQNDHYNVGRIDYSEEFIIAHDYQRGIWNNNEINTIRSLQLSAVCLRLNPANYTIWYYRRIILNELYWKNMIEKTKQQKQQQLDDNEYDYDNDLQFFHNEMTLSSMLGGENPKNYQIWYHRRALLEKLMMSLLLTDNDNTVDDMVVMTDHNNHNANILVLLNKYYYNELEYIATVIREDGKNYHAWSHRQFVIITIATQIQPYIIENINNDNNNNDSNNTDSNDNDNNNDIWKYEMNFIIELIQLDHRNNSAWNQRWFISHHGQNKQYVLSSEQADIEAEYALSIAAIDPYNESPFRYLIAILKEQVYTLQDTDIILQLLFKYYDKLINLENEFFSLQNQDNDDSESNNNCSSNLTSALIDILEWINNDESINDAIELATKLANIYDPIRNKYWNYRIQKLHKGQQQK